MMHKRTLCARRLERLQENLGAVNVELTPQDLQAINAALSQLHVVGDCYPQQLREMTGC